MYTGERISSMLKSNTNLYSTVRWYEAMLLLVDGLLFEHLDRYILYFDTFFEQEIGEKSLKGISTRDREAKM